MRETNKKAIVIGLIAELLVLVDSVVVKLLGIDASVNTFNGLLMILAVILIYGILDLLSWGYFKIWGF